MAGISLNKQQVATAFVNPDTCATVLHVLALMHYGEEIYQHDPVEIVLRIEEDFRCRMPESNENKLKAILLLTATDAFYERADVFSTICNTLSEGDPEIELDDDLTLPEMLWGMFEADLNHGQQVYSKAVQVRIHKEVQEAMDEAPDGNSAPDPYGSAFHYVLDRRDELVKQMDALGLPVEDIPEVTPDILDILPTQG